LKLFRIFCITSQTRYAEAGEVKNISELVHGETASVYGKVTGLELKKGFRSRIPMAKGNLEDATGKLQVVWFHQPYIAKMLPREHMLALRAKSQKVKKDSSIFPILNFR
jgi:RecG-like helicase